MNTSEIIVVALGLGSIAWVNWYFFIAGRSVPAAMGASAAMPVSPAPGTAPEATIIVDGGYTPNTIRVPAGATTRLVFDRRDDSNCSEEVVFADFGIRKYLPTGQRTAIDIAPKAPGKYGFTCGMGMLRGTVIAE
ncbi:MAG: cupredoxin domain-containing protein [Gemmatimonadaceae bacterium]